MHRCWALFIAYYALALVLAVAALLTLFGWRLALAVVTGFSTLQIVRVLPIKPIRQAILWVNRREVIWLFRVNFLTTPLSGIGICLLPVAAAVLAAVLIGGAAAAWTAAGIGLLLFIATMYLGRRSDLTLGDPTRFWTSVTPFSIYRKRNQAMRMAVTPFIDLE